LASARGVISGTGRVVLAGLRILFQSLIILWAGLAIYFSNLPWGSARLALAILFVGFCIWAFWISRSRRASLAGYALFAAVVVWWIAIPPSHDRPWRPEVAVMPRAQIDGDTVRFTGVRDFKYRSRHDFDAKWIEREVQISHLTGVDFYVAYWTKGPVGHTFLSFVFDNAPPVGISIETRPEVGEGFDPLAANFKQFELIYVVGEERDLVGSRVIHRPEHVFLYRLNAPPEDAQRLFKVYLKRINELADRPEWYHLLSNSCTINIIRYLRAIGRPRGFDIRHYLNGWIDGYLYDSGRLTTDLPFEEMRAKSMIDDEVRAAIDAPDFSQAIREDLPTAGPPLPAPARQQAQ
jgi:Domain of unknown function (DUF4105)